MDNQSNNQKSSFFGLDENFAAALAALIPLVLTFVPHVSYFGWIVPLIVVIFERKSRFVRFCAAQSAAAGMMMAAATAGFMLIEGAVADTSNVPLFLSLCGMLMSVLRIAGAVITALVALNGYSHRETDIPIINLLIKKII